MKKYCLLLLLVFVLSACGSTSPTVTEKPIEVPAQATTAPAVQQPTPAIQQQPTVAPQNAPAIDGASIVENQCAACHSSNMIKRVRKTHDQWDQTVSQMIDRGAQLSDAERKALVDYLTATYGN
jgi:cytochrome c5